MTLAWDDEPPEAGLPPEPPVAPRNLCLPDLSWEPSPWRADAACRKTPTRLFFPPPGERPETRARREAEARAVCEACPVMAECRAWARRYREYGFWGGESEEDRAAVGRSPLMPIGRTARLAGLAREGMVAR